MVTALTLYGVTGAIGTAGKLTTSTSTSSVTHKAVTFRFLTVAWGAVKLHSTGITEAGEPPFKAPGGVAVWTSATLSGKQFPAGTWSRKVSLKLSAGTFTGTLVLRVGYKLGTAFTALGSLTLSSVRVTTTAATQTVSGTLGVLTIPATGKLAVQLLLYGHVSTNERYITIAIGATHDQLVTPGYQTPASYGTASFVGSGVLAASPIWKGTATFVGSGTFQAYPKLTPTATFVGSGVFGAVGQAYAPSKTGMPRLTVQVALTGTCWAGTNWVTIGPFVISGKTGYGRQHELQRDESGTATLVLTNQDGRFNPWSTNSPYYNQLPPTDSNPTTAAGTWTGTNATVARTTASARYGAASWTLTATASGTMSATTDSATACTAGRTYSAIVFALAETTARQVHVSLVWKNSGGGVISSTTGVASADATGTWAAAPMWRVRGVAPAGAVSKEVRVTVATATGGEVHGFACAGVSDVTYVQKLAATTQGWCVGRERPLTPAQPIRIVANWHGTTYPVFTGLVDGWVPTYGTVRSKLTVKAHDLLHLLGNTPCAGSQYPGYIELQDPLLYWRLVTPTPTTAVKDYTGNGHTGAIGGNDPVLFGYKQKALSGTGHSLTVTPLATACRIEGASTTTYKQGSIHCTLTQPSAWSIELLLKPTVTTTGTVTSYIYFPVASWGSGANRVGIALRMKKTTGPVLVLFKGAPKTSTVVAVSSGTHRLTNGWHHIVVTHASTGATKVWITDLTYITHTVTISTRGSLFELGGGGGTAVGAGKDVGTLCFWEEVSVWTGALTSAQVATHYNCWNALNVNQRSGAMIRTLMQSAGVPRSALGTIAAGTVTCQPPQVSQGLTQLLSVIQQVDATETGLFYCTPTGLISFLPRSVTNTLTTPKGTFSNDTTPAHYSLDIPPVPALDDTTLFNTIAIKNAGSSATVFANTPLSVARYGARVITGFSNTYFASTAEATTLANKLVTKFSQPRTRVRAIRLTSKATAGRNLPQMLGRQLLDTVRTEWQPTDGSASPFVQTAQIEKISHTFSKTTWTTDWVLALPV